MISVIIPTYKRAQYIERAIDSVLNQTYKNYEIIVVDDNNPETEDRKCLERKMNKYKTNNKVIYIQHEKNKNGAAARNTAIRIAKGKYITFLDDDDYYMPRRLEVLYKILDTNKEYDAVYSSCITVRNKKIAEINYAEKKGELTKELLMQKSFFTTGSNLFFRANVIKELNGFDEKFTRHQDIELMIRFFRNHKILNVDEILVVRNEDDRKNVPSIENMFKIKEQFLGKFEKEINQFDDITRREIFYCNYQEIYKRCIIAKKYKESREVMKKLMEYRIPTMKEKIKTIYMYITNYIPINKPKNFYIDKKLRHRLEKKYIDVINKYEKEY